MGNPAEIYTNVIDEVSNVLIGNETIVENLTIALLSRGHVLLEGVPGVAKTTIANLFARAMGLDYNRIQMTPDLLPADITGTNVYREGTGEFEIQRGPIFANVAVADEINRATPKTQSALLEAMQERAVTIQGDTFPLASPFIVIATQNPIEMEGTYELPEAQRDRFQLKLTVDLLERDDELKLLNRFDGHPDLGSGDVSQVVSDDDIISAREVVSDVYIDEAVKGYILDIIAATRESSNVEYGASPRSSLAFLNATKARAAIHGREYVIPDDVKALAKPILIHRLQINTEAELSGVTSGDLVEDILESVAPPSGTVDVENADASDADGTVPVSQREGD
ncbi:AAA family ATPase [Haladaptatus halobius]|uniref:AAA family ATPase n=1 Tax=Haladaptatus halobius TaxID=2884875 RepID=UPI001D0B41D4|nr:MoxR family ATPase [Haladaptatus halobius]